MTDQYLIHMSLRYHYIIVIVKVIHYCVFLIIHAPEPCRIKKYPVGLIATSHALSVAQENYVIALLFLEMWSGIDIMV